MWAPCCIRARSCFRPRWPAADASVAAGFLAAVAAGYEAMIRIGLPIQPTHFGRGFQSTATCGGFGAAVAAHVCSSRARRTRAARSPRALGLSRLSRAASRSSSVRLDGQAHPCGSAPPRNGVAAALLVRHGFSGPTDIIEGSNGFARAYADALHLGHHQGPRPTIFCCVA